VKRIEQLLSREIGLMARSIGSAAIEAAVRERMATGHFETLDAYSERLEQNAEERRALVEDIVVSETWFFRDEEVFRDLANFANGAWRRAHPEGTLRVLCVPCATGEEPYSAAITLLESGFLPTRFSILGVDVSQRALERARAAVYGRHAFRSVESAERARHFATVGGGRQVTESVRSTVTLLQGNVLDPLLVSAVGAFDVIFCRNLLIYLDAPARARALENLWSWLEPDGVLFAGHAEAIEGMDPRFAHLTDAGHCAYVRRRAGPRQLSAPEHSSGAPSSHVQSARGLVLPQVKLRPLKLAPANAPRAHPVVRAAPLAAAAEAPAAVVASSSGALAEVNALANRGDSAAGAACERHIAVWGPSAEAYCLLGIIRNAAGAEQAAIEAFNRALYLEQTHYASLIHLALLHERRGDQAAAANFRRRAERVQQKQAVT
jgi:chemotaxis protein methyltransferase WspC